MLVANVSEFRKNLKHYIDSVAANNDTLIVNANGKSVVVISLKDYNSIEETEYLLSTPANKKMMYKALEEINSGNTTGKSSEELEKMVTKND
ncbi:MAG: type II toxin-antitoxin system Phd/YefM family antitoxin [Ginsengibacter sp.]